ncbi:hypothetical protein VNI00_006748 [Paramarasmius palmivorus]|uniref:Uncharacterized protein n=1 Tax=Paramarasmius palmivorus TaxID=297713 RepID=A0AAW0D4M3_9AGAR
MTSTPPAYILQLRARNIATAPLPPATPSPTPRLGSNDSPLEGDSGIDGNPPEGQNSDGNNQDLSNMGTGLQTGPSWSSMNDFGDSFMSGLQLLVRFTPEMARELKKLKGLSAESDLDYEAYAKATTVEEQHARNTLHVLEVRDLLRRLVNDSNEQYRVPPAVLKTSKEWASATLLSPSVYCYKGKKIAETVFNTMRAMGVSDLPSAQDTGRCDMVLEIIRTQITQGRYNLKEKIALSLYNKDGSEKKNRWDIGTLVKKCIGESRAPAIVGTYIRFAWLRSIWLELHLSAGQEQPNNEQSATPVNEQDEQNDDARPSKRPRTEATTDFWDVVDVRLESMRQHLTAPGELQATFKNIYDNDVVLYGNPKGSVKKVQELESWLGKLHEQTAGNMS